VFGPNSERGVFKTTDGGKSWRKVLFRNDSTGISDIVLDPNNPQTIYAAFWQAWRTPWQLVSGGAGSGLFKSTDGGEHWTEITRNPGLPQGVIGKIGVTVSPTNSNKVWAIVEADSGGVFRSTDGGATWTRTNSDRRLRQRAWYYTRIYADSKNPETVYALNTGFYRSTDAGRTFNSIRVPHGDNHDLWIDPDEPQRMINSNDGGANVSFNGGRTWSSIMNQPTAQFYRVTTDDRFPYRVYGAQQDNTTVAIASRGRGRAITETDWHSVGGCESGWIAPKPKNPDVVFAGCYGGSITRYDHRTGQSRQIMAWPQLAIGQAPKDLKYRIQWNAPILISPHDPNTLYHAAQVLLRSRDEGQSWEEASPDLTRNDKSKQDYSGGPITRDNTGVEVYGVIFTVMESPHEAGTIWVGTDDGLVHVTRDAGKNWQNVTPKGMPEWIQVNSIEVSPHDKATAYVAATMYKFDDFRPYLYKTNDYGKSWKKIDAGIPGSAFTRVVREDPSRRGLLYAGTETGLYVSFNDGERWQPLQLNLPVVPITDLAVKAKDLVVATQGRSFWILDDLTPLHEYRSELTRDRVRLFPPRPAVRLGGGGFDDEGSSGAAGKNPPNGVVVSYWLKEKPGEKDVLTVEFLEGDSILRTYTSQKKEPKGDGLPGSSDEDEGDKPLEPKAGLNRLAWDMRIVRPALVPKAVVWGTREGPRVAPGAYAVRLKYAGQTLTQPFEVRTHPEVAANAEDLKSQFQLLSALRNQVEEAHDAVGRIREAKSQIQAIGERAEKLGKGTGLKDSGKKLTERLTEIETKLVNPDLKSNQDVLNFPPALDHQIVGIAVAASSADARPTDGALAYSKEVGAKLAAVLAELDRVVAKDLAEFNSAVRKEEIPPVVVLPKKK
ncbi:MAG: glycosyl hydrolase, partial [Acidobacteriota bacterium]|nr:glycosyl hydrolase [Acidobacteriota bacterium]